MTLPNPTTAPARTAHLLLAGAGLALLAAGCATGAQPRTSLSHAGPDIPQPQLKGPAALAFGRPTGHTRVHTGADAIEPFLLDRRVTKTRGRPVPALAKARTSPARGKASRSAKLDTPRPVVAAASSSLDFSHTRTPASGDSQRYAARESQSQELLQYRGGDPIVITTGTLIVALLVVILILLLT